MLVSIICFLYPIQDSILYLVALSSFLSCSFILHLWNYYLGMHTVSLYNDIKNRYYRCYDNQDTHEKVVCGSTSFMGLFLSGEIGALERQTTLLLG